MATRSERLKAGIFVIVCCGLLVAVVATLAGIKFLRRDRVYRVLFSESVSGLDEGSQVSYKGVPVGRVANIRFAPHDITRVEVLLSVRSDISIPNDVSVSIKAHGITGLNFIEISGGSNEAPSLEPGGLIEKTELSLIGTVTDKFPQLLDNLDVLARSMRGFFDDQNRDRVHSALDKLDRLLGADPTAVTQGVESFRHAAADLESTAQMVRSIVDANADDVQAGVGALRRTAESAEKMASSEDLTAALRNFKEASDRVKKWIDEADAGAALQAFGDTARATHRAATRLDQMLEEEHASVADTLRNLRESSALIDEILRSLRDEPGLLLSRPAEPRAGEPR